VGNGVDGVAGDAFSRAVGDGVGVRDVAGNGVGVGEGSRRGGATADAAVDVAPGPAWAFCGVTGGSRLPRKINRARAAMLYNSKTRCREDVISFQITGFL